MTTTPFLTLERVSWQLPDGRLLFSDLDETFDARPTGLVLRPGRPGRSGGVLRHPFPNGGLEHLAVGIAR